MLNSIARPAKDLLRGPFRKLRTRYVRLRYGFGPGELLAFLRRSGIRSGDAVFLHSSIEAFKGFRGSATQIIQVFQEAVGERGSLLMPTLSFTGSAVDYAKQDRVFDPRLTPSQVGLLTELFRRTPGVLRSLHPTHSVAVWGDNPEWWTKDHEMADTPCGKGTPYARLLERDAKIVLAGLSIAPLTFFHFAEEVLAPQMPFDPFTTERYTLRYRVNGQVFETASMRLYDPSISKRRTLEPLARNLQQAGHWHEGAVGSLRAPVLRSEAHHANPRRHGRPQRILLPSAMRLAEALKIANAPQSGPEFNVLLACGFTPLHLETMVKAHLRLRFPERTIRIATGLYGDLAATLERAPENLEGVLIALEWPDVDPRIGWRAMGEVDESVIDDAQMRLARIGTAIARLAARLPVALTLPTVPIAPAFTTSSRELNRLEARLQSMLYQLAAETPAVVAYPQPLLPDGHDLRAELMSGFPFSVPQAALLATSLLDAAFPAPPKKGLITDLDETLWRGVLGDDGVEGITWDLDHKSHFHSLYQQFLNSLALSGTLVGVASKNDPDLVRCALARPDLVVKSDLLFPVEAHWTSESGVDRPGALALEHRRGERCLCRRQRTRTRPDP